MNTEFEQQRQRMERRQKALALLVADVRHLMAQPPASVEWKRTKTDLVEMIYLAWGTYELTDPYGRPATQIWLAKRAFSAVGLALPRSIYNVIWKINNRLNDHRTVLRSYL